MEHLLFFYREEAGVALDDLDAFQMFQTCFNQQPGTYGHSTHQDPTFYDLEFHTKKAQLSVWTAALKQLIPYIQQVMGDSAFSNVISSDQFGRYHIFRDANGLNQKVYLDDQSGIEQLARRENVSAYYGFITQIRRIFHAIGRENANNMVNQLINDEVGSKRTRQEEQERREDLQTFYLGFLNDVFDDGQSPEVDIDDAAQTPSESAISFNTSSTATSVARPSEDGGSYSDSSAGINSTGDTDNSAYGSDTIESGSFQNIGFSKGSETAENQSSGIPADNTPIVQVESQTESEFETYVESEIIDQQSPGESKPEKVEDNQQSSDVSSRPVERIDELPAQPSTESATDKVEIQESLEEPKTDDDEEDQQSSDAASWSVDKIDTESLLKGSRRRRRGKK